MNAVSDIRAARATGWADHTALLRAVARFNLCLATPERAVEWAMRSGLPATGTQQPWLTRFCASPEVLAEVSSAMLRTLEYPPCFDPRSPAWPLALLPDEALDGFHRVLSAALVHRKVRRTLSRHDVLRWRDWLTEPAWRFAMEGAALLPGLPDIPEIDTGEMAADDLGRAWLWKASAHWHPAIAERWRLRRQPPACCPVEDIPPDVAHRTAMTVLSAVQPRWSSRFAR